MSPTPTGKAAKGFESVMPQLGRKLPCLARGDDDAAFEAALLGQFRLSAVQYAATPPRWIPPWKKALANDDGSDLPAGTGWACTRPSGGGEFGEVAERSAAPSPDAPDAGDAGQSEMGAEASPRLGDIGRSEVFAQVLNRLIPANKKMPRREALRRSPYSVDGVRPFLETNQRPPSPSCCSASTRCRELMPATDAEMMGFRASLTKMYGNLPRAFEAMLKVCFHAPGSIRRGERDGPKMTLLEFEWCVISYIKVGDKSLASRIFLALDADEDGEISLRDFVPNHLAKGLLTMIELRRLLLSKYPSLLHAFRDLEDHLDAELFGPMRVRVGATKQNKRRRLVRHAEFSRAAAFWGLDPHQASHFFHCLDIDGDGRITLDEFLEALSTMPREVLLQDFRARLLTRCASLAEAIAELTKYAANHIDLQRAEFISALSRVGIMEAEAVALFHIFDNDGSGDVSVDEMREALREVAPRTDLEGFWHRFVAEFPEMGGTIMGCKRHCGKGHATANARSSFSVLLTETLPPDLQQACTSPTWRNADKGKRPKLSVVTVEAFDTLARRLDISRENASELFSQLVDASAYGRGLQRDKNAEAESVDAPSRMSVTSPGEHGDADVDEGMVDAAREEGAQEATETASVGDNGHRVCYVDEFLEQLELWVSNPLLRLRAPGGSAWAKQNAAQVAGPAKAAASALKAELAPVTKRCEAELQVDQLPTLDEKKRRSGLPRLPWTNAQPRARWNGI